MIDMERDLYEQVEGMVEPIIRSNARRFRRQLGMTMDDALQEARVGLMLALREYDYNASRGGVYNFASTAVRRHFLKKWIAHRAQARRPHVIVIDGNKKTAVPTGFIDPEAFFGSVGDFMDALPGLLGGPEDPLLAREGERTAVDLRAALEGRLNPRDRAVLECKIDPPRGLRMLMCEECATEPTIPLICRHLGLSKNAVDWALRRIREVTADLIVSDAHFSELASLRVFQGYAERH